MPFCQVLFLVLLSLYYVDETLVKKYRVLSGFVPINVILIMNGISSHVIYRRFVRF